MKLSRSSDLQEMGLLGEWKTYEFSWKKFVMKRMNFDWFANEDDICAH